MNTNKEEKLHGNSAKVDPKKKITGAYITNRVTMSRRKEDETPLVEDDDVEYARQFSKENKK